MKALWPCAEGMPASRWAVEEVGFFPHAEFGALAENVDRCRDGLVLQVFGKERSKSPEGDEDDASSRWTRPDYLSQVHDARLIFTVLSEIFTVLSERIGTPRPALETLSELAFRRICEAMLEIEFRAGIRGCFDSLDRLRNGARASA